MLNAFIEAGHVELSGADISERTGMLSGTLYPILIRFREAGWLKDRWEDDSPIELGRPKKRFYRLTPSGQRAFERGQEKAMSGAIAWAR
uniref:PadR family transcriptional regulator n=1 Tax=Bradyrhizobium sp. (strain ORS 278) TaxID=114615 RepID=UPI00030F2045|nr:helix-turn-helix transcriptional regulator [Bradyrhizobium sp. ORS 278]